nr:putative ribonuclease H-like domain-containing protein [Tanacetum cinerariifolium]
GVSDGIEGSTTAVRTTSVLTSAAPSTATPPAGTSSVLTSAALSSTCYATSIPSNKGVSTPEKPFPTLLMLANTFCVRAGEEYFVDNRVLVTKLENKTPYKLLLGRTPSIGEESVQQYVFFPVWSSGSKNPQNTIGDATFDDKEPEFERKKLESKVHVSLSKLEDITYFNDEEDVGAEADFSNLETSILVSPILTTRVHKDHLVTQIIVDEEDVGAEADFSNLETSITVSPVLTSRVHKDHLVTQIIGYLSSAPQTRSMTRMVKDQGGLTQINDEDFHTCMFDSFLSQEEPKRVHQALKDPSWIEAMQEELFQFKMQKVWVLVDLPKSKRAIGSKWVFRNKKDKRGIVVRNKARLVAQGHTQEEGIDYEEAFDPVARIEAIRLFLAYASFMGFMVYQMDVKSTFLYGTIEEEVNVCQPPGFEDPDYPDKVYKVVKALYGLQQAPRAWYETLSRLQVKQKQEGIFISQDKYVAEFMRKFGLTDGKSASTPIDTEKPLLKDPDGEDVDVNTYRSMIGSLMYLTSSRPDLMFAVCACARSSYSKSFALACSQEDF